MRTDHISAWLIREWLQQQLPELVEDWDFDPSEEVKAFAQKIKTLIPQMGPLFANQNILAQLAIDMWDLEDVILLAAGVPTPLTPKPEQILYYTDGNPLAVEEAQAVGYNALHVDVVAVDDFQQFNDAKTAIVTGLIHFLPDDVVREVFRKIDGAEIDTMVLSHGTPELDGHILEQYGKLGIAINLRDRNAVTDLLPPGWQVDFCQRSVDCMQYAGEVGSHLVGLPHMLDFYKISKPQ